MPKKLSRLCGTVAAAVVALAVAPAAASAANCAPSTAPTAPVFAPFGDLADYYLAPGGAFEGSLTWQKSGSVSLVTDNDPWYLAGLGHRKAARLRKDATMVTPKLCLTRDHPYLRFVAKRLVESGQLDVTVRVYDASGNVTDSSGGGISPSDHATWRPTQPIWLKTDKFAAGESDYVDVEFKSQGDWLVDDVFVDPYKR